MTDSEFNPSQRAVLASICDTFFPQLSDEDTDDIVKADKAFQQRSGEEYTEERKNACDTMVQAQSNRRWNRH